MAAGTPGESVPRLARYGAAARRQTRGRGKAQRPAATDLGLHQRGGGRAAAVAVDGREGREADAGGADVRGRGGLAGVDGGSWPGLQGRSVARPTAEVRREEVPAEQAGPGV